MQKGKGKDGADLETMEFVGPSGRKYASAKAAKAALKEEQRLAKEAKKSAGFMSSFLTGKARPKPAPAPKAIAAKPTGTAAEPEDLTESQMVAACEQAEQAHAHKKEQAAEAKHKFSVPEPPRRQN